MPQRMLHDLVPWPPPSEPPIPRRSGGFRRRNRGCRLITKGSLLRHDRSQQPNGHPNALAPAPCMTHGILLRSRAAWLCVSASIVAALAPPWSARCAAEARAVSTLYPASPDLTRLGARWRVGKLEPDLPRRSFVPGSRRRGSIEPRLASAQRALNASEEGRQRCRSGFDRGPEARGCGQRQEEKAWPLSRPDRCPFRRTSNGKDRR